MKAQIQVGHWRRQKRPLLIAGGGLVVVLFLLNGIFGQNGYLGRRESGQQIQLLTEKIEDLKVENQVLNQRIQDLRSNPHTIEKLAREQLRLGRPGDMVVTLPSTPPSTTAPSQP